MLEGVRFLWTATRGHRLRPWRSDYLKWRLETFTGNTPSRAGRRLLAIPVGGAQPVAAVSALARRDEGAYAGADEPQ